MRNDVLKQSYQYVKSSVATFLAEAGYRKTSISIWRDFPQVRHFIDFQKSQKSSSTCVYFTMNFAITIKPLLTLDDVSVENMRTVDGHLRWRIGDFLNPSEDKWWVLSEESHPQESIDEILEILSHIILPRLDTYSSTEAIIELLRSEQRPPISDKTWRTLLKAFTPL